MIQANAKKIMPVPLNTSTDKKSGDRKELVAAPKTPIIPMAAPNCGGICNNVEAKHPNVAPIKKVGTTSPPLYPASSVMAVNKIFQMNATGEASPLRSALLMTSIPAPL